MNAVFTLHFSVFAALVGLSQHAPAVQLYDDDKGKLELSFDLGMAAYRSDRSYAQTSVEQGNRTWSEAYADVALAGSLAAADESSWHATVGALTTATRGDGDAAGFTTGEEERIALEDASFGWRSGNLFPSLGKDGMDVSVGRQNFMLGSGFLIDGDAVNFGKGFDDLAETGIATGSLDRGGAYWLGRRHAFDKTALVQIGSGTRYTTKLFWFESDNDAQASTEVAGIDLSLHTESLGSFSLAFIRGLSVDDDWADFLGYSARDGQNYYNARYDGSFLHEALTISGEYVFQEGSAGNENAEYGEIAWQALEIRWKPRAGLRVSRFSEGFDPLFYGFSTGYGTWFQGEVGGNYAGPFNTNATITHLHLRAYPSDTLTIGALFYDFNSDEQDLGNLDGRELDLFLAWTVNDMVTVSPLLGLYKPDESSRDGGVQLGDNDLNVYGQVVMLISF
ncbi:MAG: hypothetical protein OEU52_17860 [Xanthomonadales bacterium]|nr:hypothetical protein [Xanthomonadales bacterium]